MGAFLRLIDLQRAAVEIRAVQCLHGARRIGGGHLDEAEASCAAGVPIADG
jgi:hypothetical protein